MPRRRPRVFRQITTLWCTFLAYGSGESDCRLPYGADTIESDTYHMVNDAILEDTPMQNRHSRLSTDIERSLRCPACGSPVTFVDADTYCVCSSCGSRYPVLDGIPILINEKSSAFTVEEFVRQRATFFVPQSRIESLLERALPDISRNIVGAHNYERFARALLARSEHPTVLVIGGGIVGAGMDVLRSYPSIRLVESDVALAERTALICDAHDIPFADGVFDGVIAQAVLEHVADPYRCVAEIYRVLGDDGLVYAETPFMQQVHGGRYDFTRFTPLGHRRLFRHFAEIDSGAVCGPGMALAWSLTYFLLSFTTTQWTRKAVRLISRLLFWPLTLFDYHLIDKRAALDAASGCYFIGSKAQTALADREILDLYRGAM